MSYHTEGKLIREEIAEKSTCEQSVQATMTCKECKELVYMLGLMSIKISLTKRFCNIMVCESANSATGIVMRCAQYVYKPAASASCMRLLLSSFSGTFLHPTHRHSEEQAIFAYGKGKQYTTDL